MMMTMIKIPLLPSPLSFLRKTVVSANAQRAASQPLRVATRLNDKQFDTILYDADVFFLSLLTKENISIVQCCVKLFII